MKVKKIIVICCLHLGFTRQSLKSKIYIARTSSVCDCRQQRWGWGSRQGNSKCIVATATYRLDAMRCFSNSAISRGGRQTHFSVSFCFPLGLKLPASQSSCTRCWLSVEKSWGRWWEALYQPRAGAIRLHLCEADEPEQKRLRGMEVTPKRCPNRQLLRTLFREGILLKLCTNSEIALATSDGIFNSRS